MQRNLQVGDLVKFVDCAGEFPGIDGDLAIIVQYDTWATVVQWMDGTRDDVEYYMNRDPFSLCVEEWLEVISESR